MLGKQVYSSQPEDGMELEQNHGYPGNVIGMISPEQACMDITLQPAAQTTAYAAIKPVLRDNPHGWLRKVEGLTSGMGRFSSVQVVCIRCL